jgi:proto-oncogene serine/threonine-protein kinase Pim-2
MSTGNISMTTNNTEHAECDRTSWDKKDFLYEEEFYRFQTDYSDLCEMLESNNGVLYTATSEKTRSEVVIKKIWKCRIADIYDFQGRECPNEVFFHLRAFEASPKAVVPIIDWYEFEDFYLIAMKKIHGARDVFSFLEAAKTPLSEARVAKIFAQMVRVAYDLHKAGICHRDLKDENFLIAPDDSIFLIDFGTTMEYDSSYSDLVGTPCFFAPEYFDRGYFRPEELTVWSLGSCLYMLLTKQWRWSPAQEAWSRDLRDESRVSSKSVNFIEQLLNPNPDERLKLYEIINSDWLRSSTL